MIGEAEDMFLLCFVLVVFLEYIVEHIFNSFFGKAEDIIQGGEILQYHNNPGTCIAI